MKLESVAVAMLQGRLPPLRLRLHKVQGEAAGSALTFGHKLVSDIAAASGVIRRRSSAGHPRGNWEVLE